MAGTVRLFDLLCQGGLAFREEQQKNQRNSSRISTSEAMRFAV